MRRSRARAALAAAAGLTAAALLFPAAPAVAASFPVINTDNAGANSLRQAIIDAEANNNLAEVDQIPISATGVIDLQTGLPALTEPVTISGPGALSLIVRRQSGDYHMLMSLPAAGTTIRVTGITLADGANGIFAQGPGTTEIEDVWIRGMVANAGFQGSGIANNGGILIVRDSTFSGNQAEFGGALVISGGDVLVENSSLAGNSAKEFGGAIYLSNDTTIELGSSTVVGNTADSDNSGGGTGGGLYNNANPVLFGAFRIVNTILAGNKLGSGADSQCEGTLTHAFASYGYNLRTTSEATCEGFDDSTDRVDPNPLIGSLSDANGGPTPTVALLPGSPAIDAGWTELQIPIPLVPPCPATDQRGLPRGGPNGPCDIGAFEFQKPLPPAGGAAPARRRCRKGFKLKKVKTKKGKKRKKCVRKKRKKRK